jgi:RNA polymerase sigma factor for flagellar operon FliA
MKKTPSNEADNFEQYRHLVKRAVARLLSHYRLVGTVIDRDDLYQMGNIALVNAIRNFNPDKNVKFETYANIAIRNAVVEGLSKFKGPISVGKDTGRILRLVAYLVHSGMPDNKICLKLEISNNKLKTLKRLMYAHLSERTSGEEYTDDDTDEIDIKDMMRSIFEDVNLTREEKQIIQWKMADKSFEAIGQDLGFSREKARKMYYSILEKIRDEVDG